MRVERAVNQLAKDLNINPVRKANIISISYASNSPELSRESAEAARRTVPRKHLKLHHPEGATDFFQTQADDYENQLKQAELKFTEFQQSNNLVVLEQQKQLTLQKTAEGRRT